MTDIAKRPLLSIVVPTRNRAETALSCVAALLKIEGDDFEVVVRDCSDTDALEREIAVFADHRLRYERGSAVSMTDNGNAAMLMTSGRYVIYIGDDDAFMPWGLSALRGLADKEVVHCIASEPTRIVYRWPDFGIEADRGLLVFERFQYPPVFYRQSSLEALRAHLTCQDFAPPLPGIYHRIASRDLMERIKSKTGAYFSSLSPDYFTYYLSANLLDEYHVMDPPISMSGSCGKSNSSRNTAKSDRALVQLHIKEYGEVATAGQRFGETCGIDGLNADLIRGALEVGGDTEMLQLFDDRYAARMCATVACKTPLRTPHIFKAYQSHALANATFVRRIKGTLNFGIGMLAFTIRHVDYKLRLLGWRESAFNKRLYRFERIPDIDKAIGIVEKTTIEVALGRQISA